MPSAVAFSLAAATAAGEGSSHWRHLATTSHRAGSSRLCRLNLSRGIIPADGLPHHSLSPSTFSLFSVRIHPLSSNSRSDSSVAHDRHLVSSRTGRQIHLMRSIPPCRQRSSAQAPQAHCAGAHTLRLGLSRSDLALRLAAEQGPLAWRDCFAVVGWLTAAAAAVERPRCFVVPSSTRTRCRIETRLTECSHRDRNPHGYIRAPPPETHTAVSSSRLSRGTPCQTSNSSFALLSGRYRVRSGYPFTFRAPTSSAVSTS